MLLRVNYYDFVRIYFWYNIGAACLPDMDTL